MATIVATMPKTRKNECRRGAGKKTVCDTAMSGDEVRKGYIITFG